MKTSTLLLAAAMTFFTAVTQANDEHSRLPTLSAGVSETYGLVAGKPLRFQIAVEHDAVLKISSRHFAADSSKNNLMTAVLRDPQGNVVATASDDNGHFSLEQDVQEGYYQLEVSGNSISGSAHENERSYSLNVAFE